MLQHKDTHKISELKNGFTHRWFEADFILSSLTCFKLSMANKCFAGLKEKGYSLASLFGILLSLPFIGQNSVNGLLHSNLGSYIEARKDTFYRFKNLEAINWRGILWFFARQFIKLSKKENGGKSPRCLIFDDSVLQKSGKFIERISRVWDHVTGRCVLGYKLLVAVYWDGSSCIPVDYSIHREKGKKKDMPFGLKKKVMKNQFRKARNHSSSAYERIKETDVSKIASMVAMLKRALRNKLEVDYVLMDSWFTCWEVVSLIIKRKGLHLIGMYKGAKTKFDYMGKSLTYSQVRNELGNPIRRRRLGYYYKQAIVQWNGKQVRLFFSKQGKNGKWKTFMSTNTSLSFIEMVKIYQLRWCIEVFFKESKQLFGLGKCQSTDFDAQIADTMFYRQDTLAFMESHVKFFAHAGGVYHQMVYDNMRVAVARFAGRNEKEPTQALANLKGHYQFHHRFCNSYRGNEKGHVERSVEYIRRKAFGFRDDFSSIGQAQAYLGKVVEKLNRTPRQQTDKTSQDLFNQEQQALWDAPTPFSCYSTEQLRVDKYATVSYCHNRYSVPDHLVGEFVDVKIYSDQLKLYYQDQQVATHKRSYGAHTWTIRLDHYLDTLHKKPGALGNSEGLAQSSGQLRALYSKYYQQVPRDFIELLIYCRKHRISKERLYDAEQALLRICPTDINTEKLMALLGNTTSPRPTTVHGHDKKIQQASKAHLLALTNLVGN
jgi:hypothetical protein